MTTALFLGVTLTLVSRYAASGLYQNTVLIRNLVSRHQQMR